MKIKTKTINIWRGMKSRCYNRNDKRYKNYGKRGIKICYRWLESFENFYEDMGEKPDKLSIHRINNNLHYSCGKCEECLKNGWKLNCKWSDYKTQARNKTNNRLITYNGKTRCLSEWAEIMNIDMKTLHARLNKKNWSLDEIFNLKPNCNNKHNNLEINRNKKSNKFITFKNETHCIGEWASIIGIDPCTLWCRLKNNWPIDKALTVRPSKKNRIK